MKPATPKPDCSFIHLAKGEKLKMIQLNRSGDKKMLEKMGREWLLTVFPALKGSFDYIGKNSPWKVHQFLSYFILSFFLKGWNIELNFESKFYI